MRNIFLALIGLLTSCNLFPQIGIPSFEKNRMFNKLLILLVVISAQTTYSQVSKTVTINGYAPTYVGQTITLHEIEDYFSNKETTIASAIVQSDSTFSATFLIQETQKISILPAKNKAFLYIQPGATYDIYLPEKDLFEPYRPEGNAIEVTFFSLDSTDINFKILQFQRWSDEFISSYYHLKNIQPIEFAKKLDEFKEIVEKEYKLRDTSESNSTEPKQYFKTFVRFSIAASDNIQFAADRNRYEKHDFYIKFAPVSYRNDAYMNYITKFYDKMIPRLSMETNNRVYLGVLKSSPTLIMRALGAEYTLINMRIREIVMVKALAEQFYTNDFPQTNILTILDSVANHSLFEANGKIARNLIDRLGEMVPGGKAQDFVLKNDKNDIKTLGNFRRKYLYLHFYDPTSSNNVQELGPLKQMYENYKEDINFITIYPDKVYDSLVFAKNIQTIPWEKFRTDNSNPIWNNYKIQTYPSYVLIDGLGYVVAAPALGPMPDGSYQTIDKTFFMIQKIKKELRDNNR
jgi:hypothetical protein